MKSMYRRTFLKQAGIISLGFSGLYSCVKQAESAETTSLEGVGFGPLEKDPNNRLSLPKDFQYKIISRVGNKMNDGFYVPARADGMAAFSAPDGRVIVVRNHENGVGPFGEGPFRGKKELLEKIDSSKFYDAGYGKTPGLGGTTTLVFNEDTQEVEIEYISLAGTYRNCAGGPTPWGSWLSCEENTNKKSDVSEQDHGYVFEVPATLQMGLADPVPIKGMGRFNHEALCVDPHTGIVYLTEDRHDSLIYRFIPLEKGNLLAGGTLQALMVTDQPGLDTRNWENRLLPPDHALSVSWIDLEDIDAPEDDLRIRGNQNGAAIFARGEGMWYGNKELYFACTNGGPKMLGQVFKYVPGPKEGTAAETHSPGKLTLFAEPQDQNLLQMCDNLTIAPWGDVILCEDNSNRNFIRGITPKGQLYTLGCNIGSQSEFAGACFSPSGKTLFINIQTSGETIAITGPFAEKSKSQPTV